MILLGKEPLLRQGLRRLVDEFGFAVRVRTQTEAVAENARCALVIVVDRMGKEVDYIEVLDKSGPPPHDRYLLLYIWLLRRVDRETVFPAPAPSASLDEQLATALPVLADGLIAHCADLLRGDFSVLRTRQRYPDFVARVRPYIRAVVGLPQDDPVRRAFHRGEWKWVDAMAKRVAEWERDEGTEY